MQSVELTFDDATDRRVRAQWNALAAAGLPSQARHTGASNRPHVTLAVAPSITAAAEARLRDSFASPALSAPPAVPAGSPGPVGSAATVGSALPVPLVLGGLLLFGSTRFVLARLVVPSAALLALQRRVIDAFAPDAEPLPTMAPGRWTPHVTLARRLEADQLALAARLVADSEHLGASAGELDAVAVRVRRWDGDAKREWVIGSAG